MNVSFEVQNDDEDMYSVLPSTWVPDLKRSRDDVSDDEPAAKRYRVCSPLIPYLWEIIHSYKSSRRVLKWTRCSR
jgi:hypothetical protein